MSLIIKEFDERIWRTSHPNFAQWGIEEYRHAKKDSRRPALEQLMADAEAGKFDVVIVAVRWHVVIACNAPSDAWYCWNEYISFYRYATETIKMLPQKPDAILLAEIFQQIVRLGTIHPALKLSDRP